MYYVQITVWDHFISKAYQEKTRISRASYHASQPRVLEGETVLQPVVQVTYSFQFEDPKMGPTTYSFLCTLDVDALGNARFPVEWDLDDLRLESFSSREVLHSGFARNPRLPNNRVTRVWRTPKGKIMLAVRGVPYEIPLSEIGRLSSDLRGAADFYGRPLTSEDQEVIQQIFLTSETIKKEDFKSQIYYVAIYEHPTLEDTYCFKLGRNEFQLPEKEALNIRALCEAGGFPILSLKEAQLADEDLE